LDMASYREVAAFALFSSDLDEATQTQLLRGQRLQEILKQPQYQPLELSQQIVSIFASTKGHADEVAVDKVSEWETDLLRMMETSHPDLLKEISEKKSIDADLDAKLHKAIESFNSTWQA